jgi:hypothetical protein
MINQEYNTSAVGKSSFMMQGKPMMTIVPQSHKRKSGYKLSLLSGSVASNKGFQIFNPNDCGTSLDDSDTTSSCVASAVKSGLCSYDAPTTNSFSGFKGNHGSGMGIQSSVQEESSDSEEEEEDEKECMLDDEDRQQQFDPYEFNPKNFYWVFNPDMKFSTR